MLLINHRKNLLFNYYSFYCVSLLLLLLLSHIIETVVELVIASNRKRITLFYCSSLSRAFLHISEIKIQKCIFNIYDLFIL